MNKDDLILVKRTNGRFARQEPTIKLELSGNRFIINEKAAELMNISHNSGVMFGFNYKEKRAYVFHDNEPDAFYLRKKSNNDNGLRFTSKALMVHFVDCFEIDMEENKYYFDVEKRDKDFLITHSKT